MAAMRMISRELVEDLNLHRFCIYVSPDRCVRWNGYVVLDYFLIDGRRRKRELRRLKRLKAISRQRWEGLSGLTGNRPAGIILDDPLDDALTTEESRKSLIAWFEGQAPRAFLQTPQHHDHLMQRFLASR